MHCPKCHRLIAGRSPGGKKKYDYVYYNCKKCNLYINEDLIIKDISQIILNLIEYDYLIHDVFIAYTETIQADSLEALNMEPDDLKNQKQRIKDAYKKFFVSIRINRVLYKANNFSCIMRTYYKYANCKNITSDNSAFFSLSFDLKYFLSKNDNINLKDLFKYQNDILLKFDSFCSKCKKIETRSEMNMFFYFPFCLVINLNYEGVNNNNKNILYPEKLNLSDIKGIKEKSAKEFNLIGIIKNLDDNYIAIIFDYAKEKKWIVFDCNKETEALNNFNEHKNDLQSETANRFCGVNERELCMGRTAHVR